MAIGRMRIAGRDSCDDVGVLPYSLASDLGELSTHPGVGVPLWAVFAVRTVAREK